MKFHWLAKTLYPSLLWHMPRNEKRVFITFDDGPVPGITDWVLDELKKYNAKATFFCVGENVLNYPETFKRIMFEGHQVGNHTYNHLNGWQTGREQYVENVEQCYDVVPSRLFRPPYGKIRSAHIAALKSKYSIVMWDVLSYDYHAEMNPSECRDRVLKKVKNGSIVVFHDSKKAFANLKETLPAVLQELSAQGYKLEALQP